MATRLLNFFAGKQLKKAAFFLHLHFFSYNFSCIITKSLCLMMIYVGNIAYSMTPDDLKELFAPFGNVLSVKIIADKTSGRSKGYGFVEMEKDEDGQKAISALNDTQVKGRNIKVNNAFRKDDSKTEGKQKD